MKSMVIFLFFILGMNDSFANPATLSDFISSGSHPVFTHNQKEKSIDICSPVVNERQFADVQVKISKTSGDCKGATFSFDIYQNNRIDSIFKKDRSTSLTVEAREGQILILSKNELTLNRQQVSALTLTMPNEDLIRNEDPDLIWVVFKNELSNGIWISDYASELRAWLVNLVRGRVRGDEFVKLVSRSPRYYEYSGKVSDRFKNPDEGYFRYTQPFSILNESSMEKISELKKCVIEVKFESNDKTVGTAKFEATGLPWDLSSHLGVSLTVKSIIPFENRCR